MKKFLLRDERGITLVELVLSMTIMSILAIVLMNFMVNWLQQNAITQLRTSLLTSTQDSLDLISDSIRLSASADQNNRWQDANAPLAPTNLQSWTSDATTLVLASAAEDTSGNILFSDPSNYTSHKNNQIYFVKNGVLYRRMLASPVTGNRVKTSCPATNPVAGCPTDRKLASNVVSFGVKYYDANNVEVIPTNARSVELSLTVQKKAFGKQIQSSDKTRMVFRND